MCCSVDWLGSARVPQVVQATSVGEHFEAVVDNDVTLVWYPDESGYRPVETTEYPAVSGVNPHRILVTPIKEDRQEAITAGDYERPFEDQIERIVSFPTDSGVEPLYVVFQKRAGGERQTIPNSQTEMELNAQAAEDVKHVTAPIDFDGHVLNAEVKPDGKVVGGHSTALGGVRVIPGTASSPNAHGVYSARIEVSDPENPGSFLPKTNSGGVSTMFPEFWSADRIKVEVDAAYKNKTIIGNKWTGVTPSGVRVEGFLKPKTTVYPKI
ncbi:EndoU domain-containing protein [Marinobacter sp. C2H3]|uniref:EndoU domain-containing protein n=1 Tax=Marinobacter sp. C2H3 TaxID=3119003 RepID=UPI003FA59DD7